MEQLGLNLGYLLVQIVCFFIIFTVVNAWIVKPLRGMLERRRSTISQSLEDARIAAEARANAEKEAAGIVTEAQARATHLISEAIGQADAAMLDVKAEADKVIAKEREAVLAEINEERNRILGDLRSQVAALAIAAAQKLIGETLDEKRQHTLISEFFSGVKSGKVTVLEGAGIAGEDAEVISALPLTKDEEETVKKNVLAKLGKSAAVTFSVDPAILGGLVIRTGDKVLDGSVAAQLDGLRQSLK